MSAQDWASEQLQALRPRYEGRWDIWVVRLHAGYISCAKPAGSEVATINVDSPEALISAIADQESERLAWIHR
jgi:hypothetical protein